MSANPNIPGFVPSGTSEWLKRSQKGFRSSSIGHTATKEGFGSNPAPKSLKELAGLKYGDKDKANGPSTLYSGDIFNRRTKGLLFTEDPTSMGGLLSGDGAFEQRKSEVMKTNNMELGKGVELKPPQVASFVNTEKVVCRFFGYFKETRHFDDSNPIGTPQVENEIIRKLIIHFYMQDNSVEINEEKNDNDGMVCGTFYAKAPLAKTDGSGNVVVTDLHVGERLDILGRTVVIYDADKATRHLFKTKLKQVIAKPLDIPEISAIGEGAALALGAQTFAPPGGQKQIGARSGDYFDRKKQLNKEFAYLQGDNRVLKFLAEAVADRSTMTMAEQLLGADIKYTLSYYLVDNTMDIKLVKTRRASRTDQSTILKRGKLPKNWKEVQGIASDAPCIGPEDIRVNDNLVCYGRVIKILDCDAATREYYEKTEGMEAQPTANNSLQMDAASQIKTKAKSVSNPVPSLASDVVEGLLPIGLNDMPPAMQRAALKKKNEASGQVLKVYATMLKNPSRNFQMFYFLEDDNLQIYEDVVKNSGMSNSGNFLRKGLYEVTGSDGVRRRVCENDMELGRTFTLNGLEWKINSVDASTRILCESLPERFPEFHINTVLTKALNMSMKTGVDIKLVLRRYDRQNVNGLNRELYDAAVITEKLFSGFTPQECETMAYYASTINTNNTNNIVYYPLLTDCMSQLYFDANTEPKPSWEGNSGSIMMNFLSAKLPWRKLFMSHNKYIRSCLPIDELQSYAASCGMKIVEEDLFIVRYLYGVDLVENNICISELSQKEGSMDAQSAAVAQGSGSKAVKMKVKSMREMLMPEGKDEGIVHKIQKPMPVFINIQKLCDDIFKQAWVS